MTNFDHYKNKIKEILNEHPNCCVAITTDNKLISCNTENFTCSMCKLYDNSDDECALIFLKWLLKRYTPYNFTEEEVNFLNIYNNSKSYNYYISRTYVINDINDDKENIITYLILRDNNNMCIDKIELNNMFTNLPLHQEFSIAELLGGEEK